MIDLYTWPTPNCRKVSILLEELKVDYNIIPIDIDKGDKVNFLPGGLHIMFVGIERDLSEDSTKDILLKFRNSEKKILENHKKS